MPELPEVETIALGLNSFLPQRRIEEIDLLFDGLLKNENPRNFRLRLLKDRFSGVERKGKFLLLHLQSGQVLVAHLRMTGNLYIRKREEPKEKHLRLSMHLDNGFDLRFVDQRKFGFLYLFQKGDLSSFPPFQKLGVDPLTKSFSVLLLRDLLKGSSRKIKDFLLDQSKISGLGNIYADEALFHAHILPSRKGSSLSSEEIHRLYASIRHVLKLSIGAQGRTFSHYRTAFGQNGNYQPLVHDSKLQFCSCGGTIEKIKLGGRSTYFCPRCQK